MRRIAAVAVAVATAMTMLTGTASAALSKGFSTKAACEKARAEFPKKSDPCFYWSSKQAWYFKY